MRMLKHPIEPQWTYQRAGWWRKNREGRGWHKYLSPSAKKSGRYVSKCGRFEIIKWIEPWRDPADGRLHGPSSWALCDRGMWPNVGPHGFDTAKEVKDVAAVSAKFSDWPTSDDFWKAGVDPWARHRKWYAKSKNRLRYFPKPKRTQKTKIL